MKQLLLAVLWACFSLFRRGHVRMRFGVIFLLVWLGMGMQLMAQPSNDDCSNALGLTVGAEVCSETTYGGSTQTGEVMNSGTSCIASTFTESVWYTFTATSGQMYVRLQYDGLASGQGGGAWCPPRLVGILYDTDACIPGVSDILDCNQAGGSGPFFLEPNSLTIGNTYLIQIGYNSNNGCKIPNYCITVNEIDPPCNTCTSYCGDACQFSSTPTVSQVTSSCTEYDLYPIPEGGDTVTKCFSFQATDTVAQFNIVISSTCGQGNVSFLTWDLYPSNCSGILQSGDLSGLEFNNLTPGGQYRFCYTLGVPSTCYHTSHYPYVVSSAQLLAQPVRLEGVSQEGMILLNWTVSDLSALEDIILERSIGGSPFEEVRYIPTSEENYYSEIEMSKIAGGDNVYRLKCRLKAGYAEYSNMVAFKGSEAGTPTIALDRGTIYFSWQSESAQDIRISMHNVAGGLVYSKEHAASEGRESFSIRIGHLPSGIYLISLQQGHDRFIEKIFHH